MEMAPPVAFHHLQPRRMATEPPSSAGGCFDSTHSLTPEEIQRPRRKGSSSPAATYPCLLHTRERESSSIRHTKNPYVDGWQRRRKKRNGIRSCFLWLLELSSGCRLFSCCCSSAASLLCQQKRGEGTDINMQNDLCILSDPL